MSKELEVLEELFDVIVDEYDGCEIMVEFQKYKDIIETALKDYNDLKERMGITDVVKEDFIKLWKEHKALEIIKDFNTYNVVEIQDQWYLCLGSLFNKCPKKPITEEQAMLLKKVLL